MAIFDKAHRYRSDFVTQHDYLSFNPGVACLAEFETIGAAQYPPPGVIASNRQPVAGNCVVKKLHPCIDASLLTRITGDLKDTNTIQPEPPKRYQYQKARQTKKSPLLFHCLKKLSDADAIHDIDA